MTVETNATNKDLEDVREVIPTYPHSICLFVLAEERYMSENGNGLLFVVGLIVAVESDEVSLLEKINTSLVAGIQLSI